MCSTFSHPIIVNNFLGSEGKVPGLEPVVLTLVVDEVVPVVSVRIDSPQPAVSHRVTVGLPLLQLRPVVVKK